MVRRALVPTPRRESAGTSLYWRGSSRRQVRLEVFDVLGRRVRTLAQGSYEAGEHALQWDGRDGSGVRLSAGVDHVRIHAGAFRAQRTMVLLP